MSEKDVIEVTPNVEQETALPYLNVYRWTTKLSSEQDENTEYIWPEEIKSLLRRLTYTQGNNVAVIGLQGSGKTATRNELFYELQEHIETHTLKQKIISVKWNGPQTIEKTLWESFWYDREAYLEALREPFKEKFQVDKIADGYAMRNLRRIAIASF